MNNAPCLPHGTRGGSEFCIMCLRKRGDDLHLMVARLSRELEKHQWVTVEGDNGDIGPACPSCGVWPNAYWYPKWDDDPSKRELRYHNDHKPDCELAKLIREAEEMLG